MLFSTEDLFSPAGAVTTIALAAIGIHFISSKKVDAANNRHTGKCTGIIVSSEHSFSDTLLSFQIDKVYLFTFPNSPHVRNISPFALKVESFLRLHKIPFEVIGTFKFSPKGQMPYIRLNSKDDGPIIADSNFIIKFLSKKLGLDEDETTLSKEQSATAHAFTRMIEEHTSQIGFYYRYGLQMDQFCSAVIPEGWFSNKGTFKSWLMGKLFPTMMPRAYKRKMRYISFGRHSDDEKWTISCQDIQSISDYLGEKKFIFGDVPGTLDCTLFGHLAQFLYIPLDFPQKTYMKENCVNIVDYVDRFKEMYWRDWESL